MEKKRVLLVVAHPDDEILGAGGTLIKKIKDGLWTVRVLILTDGVSWRNRAKEAIERQKKAATIAAKLVGYDLIIGDFKDQLLDRYPISKIVDFVSHHVKKFEPNIVMTHHWGDANYDHFVTFNAVNVAIRPIKNQPYLEKFITLFIPSSSEWNFDPMKSFKPNIFVDIMETLDTKIKILQTAYGHEMREFPHPRSKESIIYYARYFGTQIGMEAAEAFNLLWSREL